MGKPREIGTYTWTRKFASPRVGSLQTFETIDLAVQTWRGLSDMNLHAISLESCMDQRLQPTVPIQRSDLI